MELHFIVDDLDEHGWYQDLAAALIEKLERYLGYVAADLSELEEL